MGGGGGQTQTTQGSTSSIQQIPAWMSQAGQQNYALAQDIANRPLQQYQGAMVADVAPQTQQAWNLAANNPWMNAAGGGYQGAQGYSPMSLTAGQLATTNLQPYLNPYTQDVINKTLPIMQQNLALQQNQQQNQANSANAFGGSRQGIQQGVTQAQGAQGMAQMAAQLNQANFGQAQSAAAQDIASRLQAGQYNQAAGLTANQQRIAASQGLAGLGAGQFAMLGTAGAQQQQQAQDQINAQMAKFSQAFNYPQQGLGLMLSALGMTPHDVSQFGTSTQQTQTSASNPMQTALGGLQTLGSLFGGGILPGSDRRLKTAITPMGRDPVTGIPIKSFRYKGQPADAPKTIGPLAQDIEKAAPGSTVKIGGVMHVPRPTLAAATPSVAHLPQHAANQPVPGALASSDTVPAMLQPGEAVLNRVAAAKIGRGKIAAANAAGVRGYARGTSFVSPPLTAFTPPSSPGVAKGMSALTAFTPPPRSFRYAATGALTAPRAGAKAFPGALANTSRRKSLGALG